jgi:uncharacterized membrane protein YbhN (UPF0104 family)
VDVPPNVTAIVLIEKDDPTTINVNTIAGTLDLNGRTDGGAGETIPDISEKASPQGAKRRVLHYLPPVLGLLVLGGIIFGLHRALAKIGPDDVLAALEATPRTQIHHALALLALSFCLMAVYDIPGVLFAKKLIRFPRIGLHRVALASFSAYALSHVLGVAALVSAAIRLRLYAQWGVPPAGIGRIIALSGTMFTLGAATLLGGILLLHPLDVPLFGRDVSTMALRGLGAALWVVVAAYIGAAHGEKPLSVLRFNIPRPGLRLAAAQVLLSCADTATACAILYTVLPSVPGLSYAHVLAIYLAAFAGGVFSGLPGGVGVFDTMLLLGFTGYMDTAHAIGAILLFRVLYYLAPAALAGLCFSGHEIWLTVKGKTP